MAAPAIDPEQSLAVTASLVEAFDDSASGKDTLRGDEEDIVKVDETPTVEEVQSNDSEAEESPAAEPFCYGKHGKLVLWIGITLMWIVFELDHTTLYNYQNYAASSFNQISSLGALNTAGTLIIAVMKPPIAKISSVVGRVETYIAVVTCYVVSYIICATAPNFQQYAGGYVIYSIGATGMQILNQIIVADITSSRWRGLANSLISLPFMAIPWVSAFIVDGALNTIGWRWGIGMFAIIMPVTSLGLIVPLLYFRHRGKRATHTTQQQQQPRPRQPLLKTLTTFMTAIDVPGILLLLSGTALFLLPMSLAGSTSTGWSTPWVPTLTAVGLLLLILFTYYETHHATSPLLPAKYLRSQALLLSNAIALLDAFAFQITHTYMYAWSTVSHDFTPRTATFLTYTSGCFQVAAGLVTGYLMYRTRRYKWLLVAGTVVRLLGYGAMMRLRGSTNPTWELFFVQAVQGLGSGTVGTVVIVVAQVTVPSAELGQATALMMLAIFMGQAVGSAVAGAIYTNLFRPRLRAYLGAAASQSLIESVFDSITGRLPGMGTVERIAINAAYSDVLRYMTIAALVASAVPFLMVWLLPNFKLSDKHSLAEEVEKMQDDNGSSRGSDSSRRSTLASIMSVKGWFSRSEKEEQADEEVVRETSAEAQTSMEKKEVV